MGHSISSKTRVQAAFFFLGPIDANTADLARGLQLSFSQLSCRAAIQMASADAFALSLFGLNVQVQVSHDPVQTQYYENAERPPLMKGHVAVPAAEVLARHRSALILNVSGAEDAATYETQLAFCLMAVTHLFAEVMPDLIHWMPSDTLYTFTEFCDRAELPQRAPMVRHSAFRAENIFVSQEPCAAQHGPSQDKQLHAIEALRVASLRQFAFAKADAYARG